VSNRSKNGSKTAIMDVIVFLRVTLFSSTVQLHDSLRSRQACACSETVFSSQNGERAQGIYVLPKSSVLLRDFMWAKGLSAKDIRKEIFTVGNVTSICLVQ
jgi:hypothetical protein